MNIVANPPAVLEAYLLGQVDYDALLALQRRLVYEVAGDRQRGMLILCELPCMISVGREGSWAHIHYEREELRARGWPVQWVNRGGGCMLHGPGQLTVIPVLAIDRLHLTLPDYLSELHELLVSVCRSTDAPATTRRDHRGVWAGDRLLAHVGVALHEWVAHFGATINIDPDLALYRGVNCDGHLQPMTSLSRERRGPVRPALIRHRIVDEFASRFTFQRTSIFHYHPSLIRRQVRHEYAYRSA